MSHLSTIPDVALPLINELREMAIYALRVMREIVSEFAIIEVGRGCSFQSTYHFRVGAHVP
jgi:hypothetical protein